MYALWNALFEYSPAYVNIFLNAGIFKQLHAVVDTPQCDMTHRTFTRTFGE